MQYSLPTLSKHYLVSTLCLILLEPIDTKGICTFGCMVVFTTAMKSGQSSFDKNKTALSEKSKTFQVWVLPHVTPITLPIIHITQTGSVYTVIIIDHSKIFIIIIP